MSHKKDNTTKLSVNSSNLFEKRETFSKTGSLKGPDILGIITARGGSKGIPRKNLKLLGGKPLIYHTIKVAQESKLLTRIILSSDDDEIIEVSKGYGIEVPFIRPKKLAGDKTPHLPVIIHALDFVEEEERKKYDYIVILQPTNPLRQVGDIDGVIKKLIETGADSVITYFKVEDLHPLLMRKIINDRVYHILNSQGSGGMIRVGGTADPNLGQKTKYPIEKMRRQDLPSVYMRSGAVYAALRDTIKNKKSLYGDHQRPYIIPWWRGRNIDEPWEFELAEILFKKSFVAGPWSVAKKENNGRKTTDNGQFVSRNGKVRDKNRINLLWKSWYGNENLIINIPERWELTVNRMEDRHSIQDDEIVKSIQNPINHPPLKERIKKGDRICIVIDDLERPTECFRILPVLLDTLNNSGIPDKDIFILTSLGTHRPLSRSDMIKKVGGNILERIKFYNHNCYENLIFIGETTYGTPLYINRFFYEADFKIGIGMLSPHPYAGFSGGGKIVLPGISGMETIEANHKPVKKSLSGEIGKIEGNLRRAEIDEAAKIAGLNFIINTINNSEGKTAAIFSGEPEKTFNVAGKYAGEIYGTKSCYGMDIGIFNAFPKDTEMLQALNALNIWSTRDEKRSIVKKGGTIIIITAASEGCGFHGLGDKGMRMYVRRDNHGSFKELFNNRDFAFVSPNLIEGDIYDHYPSQVKLFKDWESCLDVLKGKFPEKARVAVYPCGPLQLEKS